MSTDEEHGNKVLSSLIYVFPSLRLSRVHGMPSEEAILQVSLCFSNDYNISEAAWVTMRRSSRMAVGQKLPQSD